MPSASTTRSATDLAKAALRRLSQQQLEPTPENYARAYALEAGQAVAPPPPAAGQPLPSVPATPPAPVPLADWIERVVRGLERGGRQWTAARKKDSLQRVLSANRQDVARLQERLTQLLGHWDKDQPDSTLADLDDGPPSGATTGSPTGSPPGGEPAHEPGPRAAEPLDRFALDLPAPALAPAPATAGDAAPTEWPGMVDRLGTTVQVALPPHDPVSEGLITELRALTDAVRPGAPGPRDAAALADVCARAERVLQHRHHLLAQLGTLCEELTASLTELSEDDSWARGQCEAMHACIEEGLTSRGVKSVSEMLRSTRARQVQLRQEREQARLALKGFIHSLLHGLGELGEHTGRFKDSLGRYADVIEQADTLESLAGVVRDMLEESRTVDGLVAQAQQRLNEEHARARALSDRVDALEVELRRLSDEVSTDQLTQVANRRGLLSAFEAERSRQDRQGSPLAVALLDIDNFKRLNDELGHGAGDEALRTLAALVRRTLRPTDHVARFGGEEFVLLLPDTPVPEAQQVLTRLQRALTGGLFMHEQKQVFVTFSAGVTAHREGEGLAAALERADQALYEAKRSGKNRSCAA